MDYTRYIIMMPIVIINLFIEQKFSIKNNIALNFLGKSIFSDTFKGYGMYDNLYHNDKTVGEAIE